MQAEARSIQALQSPPTRTKARLQPTASTEHRVTRYARDVVAGRIVAGPWVRGECARHLRDLIEAPSRGFFFDREKADYALNFFPTILRLAGGEFEGKAFELEPSQAFIVGSLFGWVDVDGWRRFQVAYVEEGKGNGKSPLAAGIGHLGLVADKESRAEIYAAATKKDQAMVLFRDAVAMFKQSPALRRNLHPTGRREKVWNLYHAKTNSFFRVISAEDEGQSGPRPHIGLIDEVHEHKSNVVVEMMRAGFKFRRQPLLFMITNSGNNIATVCGEYHEYACEVATGKRQDDRFFSYVCGLDEGDDPFKSEECWVKANPLLGVTIRLDYLRQQVKEARGLPSKESIVRRLNFCEWTEAHSPLLSMDAWDEAKAKFTLERFRGQKCRIGIDLSATQDLTAAVFEFKADGKYWWIPQFWMPKATVRKKSEKDKVPYDDWVRKGYVRTTPGKAIDKDFVAADIAKLIDEYGLELIESAYDRWKIETLKAGCERQGVDLKLVEFGQGFASMGPAVDALETALINGELRQDGNPCMRWNAANAVAESNPAGDRKFNKAKATGRIDGIVAGAMVHQRWVAAPADEDIGAFLRNPVIA